MTATLTCEALVLASFGQALLVEAADGRTFRCTARRKTGPVVAGDRVVCRATRRDDAIVTEVLPRASLLSRPDRHGRLRPVCANIDQLVVVAAVRAEPAARGERFNTALVDRYTVAAELLGITPLLVINKIDLLGETLPGDVDSMVREYRALGYDVAYTSAKTTKGTNGLRSALRGRASAFVGESGVGKSSLIQILLPDMELRIGELSEGSGAGRHTTTTTMLFHLPEGGDLIDSPGVREFRLWHLEPGDLGRGFREFSEHLGACKYRDCLHTGEPDCAVAAAVARGLITQRRMDSYLDILESLNG